MYTKKNTNFTFIKIRTDTWPDYPQIFNNILNVMNNTTNIVRTAVFTIVGCHLAPCFLALALLVF